MRKKRRNGEGLEPSFEQKERFKQALGTYTKLGDTKEAAKAEQKRLDKLGKALKSASDKGWRDNYTLADVAHTVIRHYENNTSEYMEYVDTSKKKVPSFGRNLICGNILEKYSAVKRTVEHGSYVQTHIAHCGNVWLCPVCAGLVQSRRAAEVEQAVAWADEHKYRVIMITFTASHYANLPLREFGKALQKAYRKTLDQMKRERKAVEVGNIKSVEFTYSERNRWHKHFHVIFFLKEDSHAGHFYERIRDAWELQCAKVGLLDTSNEKAVDSFRRHACSLTVGGTAALSKYTNKSASEWTVADEVTKSVLKIGRNNEHMTPFQMLATIATTKDNEYRGRLIRAFIEYAVHTKGMHQLDWSNGLKAAVGIVDMSDEEIVEEKQDTAVVVAGLTVAHWHILRSKCMRIRYFKMLKEADKQDKSVYQQIVDFFADAEVAGADCPDVLTAEQTQLLEEYEDREDTTADEDAEYKLLQTVLEAVAEATPRSYCASNKHKDTEDFVPMGEAQKEWIKNREKWELLDYGITGEIVKQIKALTPAEIAAYKDSLCYQTALCL